MEIAIMMAEVVSAIDHYGFTDSIRETLLPEESVIMAGAREIFTDLIKNPRQTFLDFFKYVGDGDFAGTLDEDVVVAIAKVKNIYLDIFCFGKAAQVA